MSKPKLNQPDVEKTITIGAWATSTSASTSVSTKTIIPKLLTKTIRALEVEDAN